MQVDADRDEDEIGEYCDYDAPDDFAGPDDPSAYWRRRFFILAGGIAALGLCVWLFPGGHPAPARTAAAARASTARAQASGALPSSAYGTAWPGLTTKGPSTATPSAKPPPPGVGQPFGHREVEEAGEARQIRGAEQGQAAGQRDGRRVGRAALRAR